MIATARGNVQSRFGGCVVLEDQVEKLLFVFMAGFVVMYSRTMWNPRAAM